MIAETWLSADMQDGHCMTHAGTLRAPTCIIQWTPLVRRFASLKMALSSCSLAPGEAYAACYQVVFKGAARVPFVCIGDEPLTEKLALRLQPDERDALRAEADARGVSVSALVRDLYFGAAVVSDVNRDLVEELIRLGAVVRSAWDASGASQSPYFPPLADAIVDLQKFARTLTRKIKPSRVRHDRAADVVDFGGKFDGVALKAIVTLRLLPTEKDQLAMDAEMAGITPGALVRRRIFGRPVSADINRVMQRRIRSLMAMLQHFLAEQRSRDYPEIYTTGSVLAALFKRLGHDLKTHP